MAVRDQATAHHPLIAIKPRNRVRNRAQRPRINRECPRQHIGKALRQIPLIEARDRRKKVVSRVILLRETTRFLRDLSDLRAAKPLLHFSFRIRNKRLRQREKRTPEPRLRNVWRDVTSHQPNTLVLAIAARAGEAANQFGL